jgi:hypothetical protein
MSLLPEDVVEQLRKSDAQSYLNDPVHNASVNTVAEILARAGGQFRQDVFNRLSALDEGMRRLTCVCGEQLTVGHRAHTGHSVSQASAAVSWRGKTLPVGPEISKRFGAIAWSFAGDEQHYHDFGIVARAGGLSVTFLLDLGKIIARELQQAESPMHRVDFLRKLGAVLRPWCPAAADYLEAGDISEAEGELLVQDRADR